MSIFRKLLKIIIFLLIIALIIVAADYFLFKADIISVNQDKLPDFLKSIFQK